MPLLNRAFLVLDIIVIEISNLIFDIVSPPIISIPNSLAAYKKPE